MSTSKRAGLTLAGIAVLLALPMMARADLTPAERVENEAIDAKKAAKKGGRTVRNKAREATGNDSVVKDAKDSASSVGDETEAAAKKMKNKVD